MTAQKSTDKKNSYFMANFRNRLKSNMKTSIIITILHILSVPTVLLNVILYMITQQNYNKAYGLALAAAGGNYKLIDHDKLPYVYDFNEAYLFIAFLALGIAILAGILIALSNFSYLYKKTQVDMIYSLPMTTTQRFFSDFFAGVTSYIAPFIASGFLTLILCFVGRATCEEWVNTFPDAGFGFQTLGQLIFQCYLYGTFVLLMIYTLSVLVISCCGNIVESGLYIFATNILIPTTIAVFTLILFGDLYAIDIEAIAIKAICPTSPFGAFMSLYDVIDTVDSVGGMTIFDVIWQHLVPFIFFTAIYGAVAFFLYKFRKAEDVSKPFVYKMFYYIMSTAVVFCIVSVFIGEGGFGGEIIPLIITSGIVFFIMDIIANRGFKKFWVSIIRFVATMVVMIVAVSLVEFTDGFGMVRYVPNPSSIASVTIEIEHNYNDSDFVLDYQEYDGFTTKDDAIIEAVINAHEANIDRYKVNDGYNMYKNSYEELDVTYVTHFGRKISRTDLALNKEEAELLKSLYLSDEYKKQALEFIDKAVKDVDEKGRDSKFYYDLSAYSKYNGIFHSYDDKYAADRDLLLAAIKKDVENYNGEEISGVNYGYVTLMANEDYGSNCNILLPISEQFPETYKVLSKHYEFNVKDYSKLIDVCETVKIADYRENGSQKYIELSKNFVNDAKLKKYFNRVMSESNMSYSGKSVGYFVIDIDGNRYIAEDCEEIRALYEYAENNRGTEYAKGSIYYGYYNDPYNEEYGASFSSIEEAERIIRDIVNENGYITYFDAEDDDVHEELWMLYYDLI